MATFKNYLEVVRPEEIDLTDHDIDIGIIAEAIDENLDSLIRNKKYKKEGRTIIVFTTYDIVEETTEEDLTKEQIEEIKEEVSSIIAEKYIKAGWGKENVDTYYGEDNIFNLHLTKTRRKK